MKLIKSKNCDVNYLAQVVNITSFQQHPDPEVRKLKIAQVNGYKVVVGIDSKPGWYVYFPTLSQINKDFLSFNNLFKNKELNSNKEKSGSFEDNCKVSAIKLRGQVSEGFLIEFESFNKFSGVSNSATCPCSRTIILSLSIIVLILCAMVKIVLSLNAVRMVCCTT